MSDINHKPKSRRLVNDETSRDVPRQRAPKPTRKGNDMAAQATPATPAIIRKGVKRGDPLKLDRAKVQELANQGLTATDIAKHQHVAISTVTRYLHSLAPETAAAALFREKRSDAISVASAKKSALQDMIVNDWLSNPEKVISQDVRLQKELLHTIQGGLQYEHQQQLLEDGRATVIADFQLRGLAALIDATPRVVEQENAIDIE